jgi:hypothetical protein
MRLETTATHLGETAVFLHVEYGDVNHPILLEALD